MASQNDLSALFARLSLPATSNRRQDSGFLLCDNATTIREAVGVLKSCSTLILDCEALSLGNKGGRLSLISIRTTPVSTARTFVIDALALTKEELQPILDLIQSKDVRKVVFDGRMDYCALFFEYNIRIQNVVDVQLADVQSRTLRGETTFNQRGRLIGYLLYGEVTGWKRERYEQVHMLPGVAKCLKDHGILGVQDKTVVDHTKWLQRPLSAQYLSYAAQDVYIIGIIYDHFLKKRLVGTELPEQSARYVSIWENDQPLQGDVTLVSYSQSQQMGLKDRRLEFLQQISYM
ncbi:hypothetical protein D9758_009777 [Tetrapyrgos nigripes]|uniref:3'-5' exonuclease domain-containing protein n=1 Tax=Tetrapyrgos nigripes TaxID=182062 RepID=A0A8H5GKH5_9AGAR|nr:hypothetical protein D9758_009777 [Tetrapyrgos nigripes]